MQAINTLDDGERDGADRRGKAWSLAQTPQGDGTGWVRREFIGGF
jgi:hypothetical protein